MENLVNKTVDIAKLQSLCSELRVLYVEDDISIQASMVRYLKRFFPTVIYANNGLEGLEIFKNDTFDLIITDLSMPIMNGIDMIEKIKQTNPEQAILITTAHTQFEYMFQAIKLGVDGYVIKPFDFEQLNSELYKIVEKIKKFAENEEYQKHLQEMVDKKTSELTRIMHYQSDNYEKTLISMVEMIEERDTYTAGHSKRVAMYSKKIAEQMGLDEKECTKIYQAGILHDIGKVATPDAVLLNPKDLNEIEYKLIQEHVEVGFKLLNHIPMFESLSEIVHSHHERYDGKGYPRGLKADEIHPLARIMTVADSFDAMTTSRIYKARKSVQEALKELSLLKAQQFHPDVVESAVIALKDVEIDENITQIPKTKLEEERFAYFYKDRLTDAYNQNYLEVVLMKNAYAKEFKHLYILLVKHFSRYNKEAGWDMGDEFLHTIATYLNNSFEGSLVFRIFGDDFVLLSKEEVQLDDLENKLHSMTNDICIEYTIKYINLVTSEIESVSQLEYIK